MPNSSWWRSIKTEFKRGLEPTPQFKGIDDISQHSTLVILITDSETYIFIKWSFFIINLRLGSLYWDCGHEIKSRTTELQFLPKFNIATAFKDKNESMPIFDHWEHYIKWCLYTSWFNKKDTMTTQITGPFDSKVLMVKYHYMQAIHVLKNTKGD